MARTPLFRYFLQVLQNARRENLKAAGQPLPIPKSQVRWTRRRFIQSAALASGAALTTNVLPLARQAWSRRAHPSIVIVGAGIAGLNAAYQLKQAGLQATVYEARSRVGGRMRSLSGAIEPGIVTDLGGSFINTDHADILALVEAFGLTLFNRLEEAEWSSFPETAYYFDGRQRPEAEVAENLRPLADQIAADAALLDEDFDQFAPRFDRLSVTEYLNRNVDKIPEPFVRTLVENSIRTEYGVEPEHSSALQLLFNLPTVNGTAVEVLGSSDEAFFVAEGSSAIADRLAQALYGQIQRNMPLTAIQQRGNAFRLTFGNSETVDADYVILALPFTVLREIDLQVNLPQKLKRFINEVDLGSNEKLFAGFEERVWRQPSGFASDIWTDLGFAAAWDESQRQLELEAGVLMFFMGGDETQAAQRSSADSLGRRFVNQFNQVIPGARAESTGRFLLTEWTQDPLAKGAYTNFKPGQLTAFGEFLYIESDFPEERQDVNVGNLIFAGEHLSDEFYGYMNGAAQTGRLAAEIIIRDL